MRRPPKRSRYPRAESPPGLPTYGNISQSSALLQNVRIPPRGNDKLPRLATHDTGRGPLPVPAATSRPTPPSLGHTGLPVPLRPALPSQVTSTKRARPLTSPIQTAAPSTSRKNAPAYVRRLPLGIPPPYKTFRVGGTCSSKQPQPSPCPFKISSAEENELTQFFF